MEGKLKSILVSLVSKFSNINFNMATVKGGRPGDPVRQFFQKLDGTKSKCVDCSEQVSSKIERLRAHRKRCPKAYIPVPSTRVEKRPAPEMEEDEPECQPPPAKRPLQSQMSSFAIKTDTTMAALIDQQVAKFFYACNIPFNVAEQKEFKTMISMLRPGYTPPSRKTLSGTLLDKVFDQVNDNIVEQLEGKDVTLVQDGWSDVHNQPVIASCVHTGNKSFFITADDTGSNKKTASYCASLAEQAMSLAETKFKCKVRGVVTDNEKKMEVMRKELQENNDSLHVYGCSSHLLNLLGDELSPNQITSQVVEVNKYFRNHHRASALLSEYTSQGAVKPQLIGATRWNSQRTAIDTFLKNRPFFLMITAQHEDLIEQRIRNLINNIGLYREAKNLLDNLTPVASALDRLQSDTTSIADACDTWLGLLREDCLQPHIAKVQKRFKQAITPTHFLAYCLHPNYRGEHLSSEQVQVAHDLLLTKNPELFPHFCCFQSEEKPFLKSMFHTSCVTKVDPCVWWKTAKKTSKDLNGELCDLASVLLKLPSSSASIERIFSNFGAIQTKLRNRLGLEKAAKLVTCYRALRGDTDLDW